MEIDPQDITNRIDLNRFIIENTPNDKQLIQYGKQ